MKKTIVVAMVFAAFMAGSGCIKDKEKDFAEDQVSFSANTGALETRTDYGEDGSVGGTSVTYVNWVAGDKIMILSSTGSNDTYTVSEDHDGSDSQGISKANVNPDNSGIAWGTGEQTFYAMYPANVSGSSLTSSAMTCVVPVTWTPASETELGQLPYGYMFAKETTSRTTSVSLTFDAKFTSFTFTLKNPTTSAVTLSSLSLSSANKAMNGTYTVNTSNGNIGTLPTAGSNKSITVDFTSLTGGGLTVPGGTTADPGTRTFTLVAVPDTFSDLTVSCTSSGGASRTLPLKKNGSYLTFDALKKHNINITLPSFAAFEYTFEVINPTDLSDLDGTSSTAIVRSYKSSDGGNTKTPVSWSVDGYYDTEAHAAAGGSSGKLNPSDYTWLGSSSIAAANPLESNQIVSFTYNTTPQTGLTDLGAEINRNIAANTSAGGTDVNSAVNLADANRGTGTTITESANCYIVNGPGWYKIPVVMGNGVINGALNSNDKTYKGGGSNSDAVSFYNYQNSAITTPILVKPTSASVIWQDFSGLVALPNTNFSLTSTVGTSTVYWLVFQVPETTAAQGNAIIAVKDANGVVMWSYHIWVTDYVKNKDAANNMSSLLGWVTTEGTYAKSKEEKVYIRLKQSVTDVIRVLSLELPAGKATSVEISDGYAPYYQWGRKDPIRPKIVDFSVNTSSYVKITSSNSGYASMYYESIIYPGFLMLPKQQTMVFWGLNNRTDNLWCAGNSSNNSLSAVVKTIYDPCPAGYSVPNHSSIESFSPSSYFAQGWRDPRYVNHNSVSSNDGRIQNADNLYLWSADPSSSNNNQAQEYLNGSKISTYKMNALNILPMKN